jgi:uncharacterized protein (DUF488 family)
MQPFFTIGHSTRPIDEFISLLVPNGIARVIDVRSFPRSRTNPQYNIEALPAALAPHGIAYEHLAALGGKRSRQKDVPEEVNDFWDVAGFHNYADYALGEEFRRGFGHLLERGDRERVAVMCAEAVWWRCHRRIVADYLLARGVAVSRIMGPGKLDPARLTPSARPQADGTIIYPEPDRESPGPLFR